MWSTKSIFAITAGTLLTASAAYAVYFDYKRRSDPQFRKELRRGRRQVEKKREREQKDQQEATKKDFQQAWKEIRDESYPSRPEEMEQFFLTQISQAEGLLAQGPTMYITAAQHFYKALKVYPNTVELLEIYNKTVPEAAYKSILGIKEADEAEQGPPPQAAMD